MFLVVLATGSLIALFVVSTRFLRLRGQVQTVLGRVRSSGAGSPSRGLYRTVRELERDLKKILRVTGRTRAERVGAMIRLRLLEEGYTAVRITGGLPRTRSGRALVRVPVDAERDGLRFRGVVVMRGNEIEETRLGPEHRMFP